MTLAVGLSGYKDIIDNAYDLAELSKYVEYFTVMTYDYHGSWERKLGHVSPLYYRDGDRNSYYNTVSGRQTQSDHHHEYSPETTL